MILRRCNGTRLSVLAREMTSSSLSVLAREMTSPSSKTPETGIFILFKLKKKIFIVLTQLTMIKWEGKLATALHTFLRRPRYEGNQMLTQFTCTVRYSGMDMQCESPLGNKNKFLPMLHCSTPYEAHLYLSVPDCV